MQKAVNLNFKLIQIDWLTDKFSNVFTQAPERGTIKFWHYKEVTILLLFLIYVLEIFILVPIWTEKQRQKQTTKIKKKKS